jgi:hypothetical protein
MTSLGSGNYTGTIPLQKLGTVIDYFVLARAGGEFLPYQVHRFGIGTTSVPPSIVSALPLTTALEQNYPNPFNPSTTIRFALKNDSWTSVKIFDALGREVGTLVNEMLPAGTYGRTWDGSAFSSGVYFCMLRAGDFVSIKRMILMK